MEGFPGFDCDEAATCPPLVQRMSNDRIGSSFRDPSGFLFRKDGRIQRQINRSYGDDYDLLMSSGLYDSLTDKGWLIRHAEVQIEEQTSAYRIIQPEQVSYISYPYEWSFSQLKDAALLTMDIQIEALKHGMHLKDASAYNIQFHSGRPVLIDTLSFERYEQGKPWQAYKQFCQHFLAPLALAAFADFRLLRLLQTFIDGIPLDLTSRMLPRRTWLRYPLLAHIHLHARAQRKYENVGKDRQASVQASLRASQIEGLMISLRDAVRSLVWKNAISEWGDYYQDTNYADESMEHKERLISTLLRDHKPNAAPTLADFGANTGRFSRIASGEGYFVLAHDIDAIAVDKNYRESVERSERSILPLLQDLTSPSPAIGWANQERMSFAERNKVDVGMALALIHHICIANNVPMKMAAKFFSSLCGMLIIEFVPKSDSQVARLLATREDIFPDYHEDGFEDAFRRYFKILTAEKLRGSERTLYLLERRPEAVN